MAGSITWVSQKAYYAGTKPFFLLPNQRKKTYCNEPDMEGEGPLCKRAASFFLTFPSSWLRWPPLLKVWHLCTLCLGVTPGAAGPVTLGTVLYWDLDDDNNLVQSRQYTVCLP